MNKKSVSTTSRRQAPIKLVLKMSTERVLSSSELTAAYGGVLGQTSGTIPCTE